MILFSSIVGSWYFVVACWEFVIVVVCLCFLFVGVMVSVFGSSLPRYFRWVLHCLVCLFHVEVFW